MRLKLALAFQSLLIALSAPVLAAAAPTASPVPDVGRLCTPTHIGFFGDRTTITDAYGNRIKYRDGAGAWRTAVLGLDDPHNIARLPSGAWLVTDADNQRMVQFNDFESGERIYRTSLAGFTLSRPHDVIIDPQSGYAYLIDGNSRLFRFRDLAGPVDVWSFPPKELAYARSLSWMDGKLHVIHSSRGEVLRIDDFEGRKYTRFKSPRPTDGDFGAGTLQTTGLILNDVEFFHGWYYGTSYFTKSYSQGAKVEPARLVRWRSWQQFEAGKWEDISNLVPKGMVPYYLTLHDDALYIPIFNHESRCEDDTVLKLVD